MTSASTWREIPSPFDTAPGSVLLADLPPLSPRKLKAILLDESYPKPFVIDDGQLLTLYFNIRLIQSVMRLDAPGALELRYTRKMMTFLLFNPRPKRIALIGMGGGSLVKFCATHLPQCRIAAIEFDPDVLAFRDLFKLPPDGPRLEVLHADGARRRQFDPVRLSRRALPSRMASAGKAGARVAETVRPRLSGFPAQAGTSGEKIRKGNPRSGNELDDHIAGEPGRASPHRQQATNYDRQPDA